MDFTDNFNPCEAQIIPHAFENSRGLSPALLTFIAGNMTAYPPRQLDNDLFSLSPKTSSFLELFSTRLSQHMRNQTLPSVEQRQSRISNGFILDLGYP